MADSPMGRRGCDRVRGRSSRAVPARSVRASIAIGLLIVHLAGCYHYVPVSHSAMPSGTEVSVGITDRGRVALSERVGPGVRRIGGQVLESTDSSLVLAVTSVEYIDLSIPAKWAGNRVEIARDLASEIRERQLSRPRTLFMAGFLVAAAIAASTIAITGFGADPGSDRPGGDDPGQQ